MVSKGTEICFCAFFSSAKKRQLCVALFCLESQKVSTKGSSMGNLSNFLGWFFPPRGKKRFLLSQCCVMPEPNGSPFPGFQENCQVLKPSWPPIWPSVDPVVETVYTHPLVWCITHAIPLFFPKGNVWLPKICLRNFRPLKKFRTTPGKGINTENPSSNLCPKGERFLPPGFPF